MPPEHVSGDTAEIPAEPEVASATENATATTATSAESSGERTGAASAVDGSSAANAVAVPEGGDTLPQKPAIHVKGLVLALSKLKKAQLKLLYTIYDHRNRIHPTSIQPLASLDPEVAALLLPSATAKRSPTSS